MGGYQTFGQLGKASSLNIIFGVIPVQKSIVEEEVFVVCLRGQPLKYFTVGLFIFGDKKSKSF